MTLDTDTPIPSEVPEDDLYPLDNKDQQNLVSLIAARFQIADIGLIVVAGFVLAFDFVLRVSGESPGSSGYGMALLRAPLMVGG